MNYENKLLLEGYSLENSGRANKRPFESAVRSGNLIFVSGHAGRLNGELINKGIVGANVSVEQAQETAKAAFVNCLRAVKEQVGDLDKITKIVNIKGYVASTPEFTDHPKVMDAVTEFANKIFGEAGKHSRVALGMSSLPGGTSVEVEIVVEVCNEK